MCAHALHASLAAAQLLQGLPHLSIAHARQQAAKPLPGLLVVVHWPPHRLQLLQRLLHWLLLHWLVLVLVLLLQRALSRRQLLRGLVQQGGGGVRGGREGLAQGLLLSPLCRAWRRRRRSPSRQPGGAPARQCCCSASWCHGWPPAAARRLQHERGGHASAAGPLQARGHRQSNLR